MPTPCDELTLRNLTPHKKKQQKPLHDEKYYLSYIGLLCTHKFFSLEPHQRWAECFFQPQGIEIYRGIVAVLPHKVIHKENQQIIFL